MTPHQTIVVSDVNVERDMDDLLIGCERPAEVNDHLLHYGFIRIEAGLFSGGRFATLDQIADVTDKQVQLHVAREELVSL